MKAVLTQLFRLRLQIAGTYEKQTFEIDIRRLILSRVQAGFTHYAARFIQATFRFPDDFIQPSVIS